MNAKADIADETPLSFESPESTSIHSARYDPDTRQLFITFAQPTSAQNLAMPTYRYTAIDLPLWLEFYQSTSRGKFVASRIRPFYVGVKV
jgi:hypothetical protein